MLGIILKIEVNKQGCLHNIFESEDQSLIIIVCLKMRTLSGLQAAKVINKLWRRNKRPPSEEKFVLMEPMRKAIIVRKYYLSSSSFQNTPVYEEVLSFNFYNSQKTGMKNRIQIYTLGLRQIRN